MGGDFDRWLTSVDLYLDALDVTSEARKRAMLLHLIGPDLQQVFGTLPEPVGVEGAYEISKAKLRAYLTPARNTIAEKLAFSTIRMEAGEKFEAYLARLRVAANRCGFTGQSVDQEVRNQCLAGTKGKLQERLLQRAAERGDQLTLQDVVAAATAMERTEALIEQMRGPSSAAEPGQLVNGTDMEFVVDTGSPVTIIGSDSSVPGLCLQRSDLVLSSFTGHAIPVKGEAVVKVQRGTKQKNLRLVVVDFPQPVNLLGRDWFAALGLGARGEVQVTDGRTLDEPSCEDRIGRLELQEGRLREQEDRLREQDARLGTLTEHLRSRCEQLHSAQAQLEAARQQARQQTAETERLTERLQTTADRGVC
ncbi:hypothetical protein FJT64_012094 [Amphibalanus amphitrite]|uniref:Peptidase A2 domain-containing protein n=1 Tax=Amphibalanus amphitrite TaxID=1232801 RepID=A0A6A4V970_AMPAM|nr:hypothetical protein FJT64_012094 [Amphibalanus amphitrite]